LCALPREARAEAGWTREVVCGGGAKSRRGVRGPAVLLFGEKLDLNRAGVRELDILPGIGPARAEAIVRARCQERFRQIEDLQQIRGIGATTTSAIGKWAEVKEGASAVNGGESSVACGDSGVQREILEPAAGLPDEG
jgi:competence ComEA-like helix-hairpin-helix protein